MKALRNITKKFSAKQIAAVAMLAAVSLSLPASAQSLDEARTLAEDGSINEAIEMLRVVTAENPKDNASQLLLGELLWNSGQDAEAIQTLEALRKKGYRDATLKLAEISFCKYDLEQANTLLAAYRKTLRSGKKQVAEDMSGTLADQIEKAETMLDRVQNIEVIDSVDVDVDEFFKKYPVSAAAGRFYTGDFLPSGAPSGSKTMVQVTESGNRMVWAAPDENSAYQLYGSSALLGNEWEAATLLGEELGEGGDCVYPYLMPDGITLYYSNDGENSLGGFDIFQTRKGDDGFLQAANIGMPFNSPYNDYLLVVDEYTGAGWFASDRNRHPGKITIYTFVPQDLRVNVDVDSPDLASLALLDDISKTQQQGKDYASLRRTIQQNSKLNTTTSLTPDFLFALPGNKVYTSLDDFNSSKAKAAMQTYLSNVEKFEQMQTRLASLREAYRKGDRSQVGTIHTLETQVETAREELTNLRYSIVKLESSR